MEAASRERTGGGNQHQQVPALRHFKRLPLRHVENEEQGEGSQEVEEADEANGGHCVGDLHWVALVRRVLCEQHLPARMPP